MATEAIGGETPTLFLRKATGLVRGWSVRDSIIYACLATNFVTLGIYEFTFAGPAFPKGQLITAVLISGVWVSFLVIAYAGLIVTIPRAGGDYVWQTRILGSGIGFVMAVSGWWFILWLWAPIYGNILSVQLFQPLWATLGWTCRAAVMPGSARRTGSSWSRSSRSPWPASWSRWAWAGTRGSRSGASTRPWSGSRWSSGCCCSTRTPASSARSTSRRTSCSASTTLTRSRTTRPPRPGTQRRRSDSARSGRACSSCQP